MTGLPSTGSLKGAWGVGGVTKMHSLSLIGKGQTTTDLAGGVDDDVASLARRLGANDALH